MLLPILLLAQTQYYSMPYLDAPELAKPGSFEVGVRTLEITNPQQPDVLKPNSPLADRSLKLEVWYPAELKAGERSHTVYNNPMVGRAPRPEVPNRFEFPGRALRDAAIKSGSKFPVVIVSHGYPGSRTFMTWVTENIASKGYIVAAIDHTDSVHGEVRGFQSTLVNRVPDQLFTLKTLSTDKNLFLASVVDPERGAIIGYSMGGYGAVASGGGAYSPVSAMLKQLPLPNLPVPENLKAIVAIAPWGAQPPVEAWTKESAKGLKVPSLFIVGTQDDVSGYEQGVKKLYDWSTSSNRCLLTYQNARHNTGGNPAPSGVTLDFAGIQSFEEPVWRKDRIIAINLHFITAFLDQHLKADSAKQTYFVPGDKGALKGFQPRWALGFDVSCQTAGQ